MVGTSPNHRRHGLGRALYERFFDDVAGARRRRVTAITWPGNRSRSAFHRAMGFTPTTAPARRTCTAPRPTPTTTPTATTGSVFSREL